MFPYLNIGSLEIPMRELCISLGTVIGALLTGFMLYRNRANKRLYITYFIALLLSMLGTRLMGLAMYYDSSLSPAENISQGGENFSGFVLAFILLFPILYGVINKSFEGFNAWSRYAPFYLCTQHFFSRLGCLAAGCCYGFEYRGPFAIYYSLREAGRFPTQPLESLIMAAMLVISFKLYRSKRHNIYYIFLVVYGIMEIVFEFLIDNAEDTRIMGLTIPQYAGMVFILVGIIFGTLYKRNSKSEK